MSASEPKGDGRGGEGRRWVLQEHAASTHHFDFRLEVDGVLKSWAVPKGPSTDPREKRLAIPTEDHPLDYIDFEGVIPEGQYGAGTVIVWDRGTYRNLTEDEAGQEKPMERAIEDGHASFWLDGEKISGGYSLTRIDGPATRRSDDEERWLLVKMDDQEADARRNPVSTQPESVKTGRTMKEVVEEEGESADEGDTAGGDS